MNISENARPMQAPVLRPDLKNPHPLYADKAPSNLTFEPIFESFTMDNTGCAVILLTDNDAGIPGAFSPIDGIRILVGLRPASMEMI